MSGIWPDDIQCVALITFDVDGVSSWLRRNADFANYPSLLSMAETAPASPCWRRSGCWWREIGS